MNKIESLTEKQKKTHDEYKAKWLGIGISTERADRPRAEKALTRAYEILGHKPPCYIWCESPLEAMEKYKIKEFPYFIGQQDSYWIAFYLFCRDELGVQYENKYSEILDLHAEVAQSCGWWWPFENTIIICERPIECYMKNGVLHKDGGMSILFRDGFGSWNLNGVRVSKEIAETSAEKLDPRLVIKENNAEVRREIVRKIGIERIILKLGAEVLDKKDDYELLLLDLQDGRKREFLKMKNPSIATIHIEGVPPGTKTVLEALEWRNGTEKTPTILT